MAVSSVNYLLNTDKPRKVFRIGTVRYNWPMSAHASQAFSIAHCTDSEDLPKALLNSVELVHHKRYQVLGISLAQEEKEK